MNQISLTGFITSGPATFGLENNLRYTSFRLRVHGSYLNSSGDPYSYDEQHTVICVGKLDQFIRAIPIPRDEEITVTGELRSRIHTLRICGTPIAIDVRYPCSEVVADSITWRDVTLARTGGYDVLIALYKPDPA